MSVFKRKKPFWRNFLKKRKTKPQTGMAVRTSPKKRKTKPERWVPPFGTKKGVPLKVDKQDSIVITDPNGFELGQITATVGIMLQMRMDYTFQLFVDECLERFRNLDWGGVNEHEWWINDHRIITRTGTICGIYTELTSEVQIWIATDLDHGITRICLSEER